MYYKTHLVSHTGEEKEILSFGPLAVLPRYQRLGVDLEESYPTVLLAKELAPGALAGKRWYFTDCDAARCCEDTAAVETFDRAFPPGRSYTAAVRRNSISTAIPALRTKRKTKPVRALPHRQILWD